MAKNGQFLNNEWVMSKITVGFVISDPKNIYIRAEFHFSKVYDKWEQFYIIFSKTLASLGAILRLHFVFFSKMPIVESS